MVSQSRKRDLQERIQVTFPGPDREDVVLVRLRVGEWSNVDLSKGPVLKVSRATATRWMKAQSLWDAGNTDLWESKVAPQVERMLPDFYFDKTDTARRLA